MKYILVIVLKSILFLILMPAAIALTQGFITQMSAVPEILSSYFIWGIFSFLIIHLFFVRMSNIYKYGKSLVAQLFQFSPPISQWAQHLVSIYTIVILVVLYLMELILRNGEYGRYFVFFAGFSLTLHFVFASQELREQDTNVVKPNYFFSMLLMFSVNIIILGGLFDLCLDSYSFQEFAGESIEQGRILYIQLGDQLLGISGK